MYCTGPTGLRMRQLVNATYEQVEKMREAAKVFFFDKGVDPVRGLLREDWAETNRVFAEAKRERERRGENSIVALLSRISRIFDFPLLCDKMIDSSID